MVTATPSAPARAWRAEKVTSALFQRSGERWILMCNVHIIGVWNHALPLQIGKWWGVWMHFRFSSWPLLFFALESSGSWPAHNFSFTTRPGNRKWVRWMKAKVSAMKTGCVHLKTSMAEYVWSAPTLRAATEREGPLYRIEKHHMYEGLVECFQPHSIFCLIPCQLKFIVKLTRHAGKGILPHASFQLFSWLYDDSPWSNTYMLRPILCYPNWNVCDTRHFFNVLLPFFPRMCFKFMVSICTT